MDISPDHITGMGDTLMMLKVRHLQNDDFDALFCMFYSLKSNVRSLTYSYATLVFDINHRHSSLFVLIVTSIWTFVLSVMVNAPAESLEKKEL